MRKNLSVLLCVLALVGCASRPPTLNLDDPSVEKKVVRVTKVSTKDLRESESASLMIMAGSTSPVLSMFGLGLGLLHEAGQPTYRYQITIDYENESGESGQEVMYSKTKTLHYHPTEGERIIIYKNDRAIVIRPAPTE